MTNNYPRETVEFLPVTVTVDGVTVTEGVEFCVTPTTDRPDEWATPTILDDRIGVMIENYEPGTYWVWARVTDTPEIPVISCGYFRIT